MFGTWRTGTQSLVGRTADFFENWSKSLASVLPTQSHRHTQVSSSLIIPPVHVLTSRSCLYHTVKILLYRPMLSSKCSTAARRPDPEHLIECLTAATSTIAIFDLFVRTFGDSHCVLSLSYSIYTAASIFLLQVQANSSDDQAFKRLDFCMRSLDRVKGANPVIASALNNIVQELIKLNIPIAPQFRPQAEPFAPYVAQSHQPFGRTLPAPMAHMTRTPQTTPSPAQIPLLDGINFEDFKVTPEMFEAYSSLQPITATVGGIEESWSVLHNLWKRAQINVTER